MSSAGWALVLALLAVALLATTGVAWAARRRRRAVDPLVERAEMASKLAHELKNPLMAIRGLASTGVRLFDRMSDEERRDFFELIDEEAGRLQRVVEQSATAMRLDADALLYDLRDEDLGELVEEVARTAVLGDHPIEVDADHGVSVRADHRRLSEAVANLLDNAANFSPPDAPIEVTARRNGDDVVIEVADRGPGIPDDRLDQVFERFGRWRPPGYEETPGAGLGLFLARAHVTAHGGRVDVVDRDGGGTILRVTLPTRSGGDR